jgi:hypothetical protein
LKRVLIDGLKVNARAAAADGFREEKGKTRLVYVWLDLNGL